MQLVLVGHSHIWNRSKAGEMHLLETSSVGNCFGAYWTRPDGTPVPFVCSNNISTFSILDTGKGVVSSYAFDVRDPAGQAIEFDRFSLRGKR